MTPLAALSFERTAAARASAAISWDRTDQAFFAAGACHQLAFVLAGRTTAAEILHLRPRSGRGSHVIARLGDAAFDFNGWSDVDQLLAVNTAAAQSRYGAGWACDLIRVPADLTGFEAYCRDHGHRQAVDYAGDVVARAETFIGERWVP